MLILPVFLRRPFLDILAVDGHDDVVREVPGQATQFHDKQRWQDREPV